MARVGKPGPHTRFSPYSPVRRADSCPSEAVTPHSLTVPSKRAREPQGSGMASFSTSSGQGLGGEGEGGHMLGFAMPKCWRALTSTPGDSCRDCVRNSGKHSTFFPSHCALRATGPPLHLGVRGGAPSPPSAAGACTPAPGPQLCPVYSPLRSPAKVTAGLTATHRGAGLPSRGQSGRSYH